MMVRPALILIACMFAGLCVPPADAATPRSKHKAKALYNCSKKVQESVKKYNKRRFGDVQITLADVKFQCSGHDAMDTVIFYLGKSLMMLKRTEEAKTEFQQLIRDFPRSPFTNEARYRIGHCSYIGSAPFDRDQAGTKDAIRELTEFIENNAGDPFVDSAQAHLRDCREKLAKKEFTNARFYEKTEEYESAVVYYKVFLEEYPDSKLVPEAKLSMAGNLIRVKRIAEARESIEEILSGTFDDAVKSKAQALKARLDK